MDLHKLILTNNACYKAGRTIVPKGIMVHSTGANNPWLKRYVGPDDGTIATYQTLPWNMRGWHCGGSGNDSYIGFEICEDGLNDASYFSAVYREAAERVFFMYGKFDLSIRKRS